MKNVIVTAVLIQVVVLIINCYENIKNLLLTSLQRVREDESTRIKSLIMGMVCDAEIDALTASKIIKWLTDN